MTLRKLGGSGWWEDDEQPGKKWSCPEEHAYFKARRPTLPEITREGAFPHEEVVERHPAFGQIGASHITSTGTYLYGSDFAHKGYVSLKISRSELRRGLSHDRYSSKGQLIEVLLSEAQWATMISSLNMGSGVPCTIDELAGAGPLPQLGGRTDRKTQFKAEVSDDLMDAEKRLDEMAALIESGKMRKGELLGLINLAKNKMGSAVDYVAKTFGEHVETTVEHAKVEIEAYMTGMVQRAGLKALAADGTLPLSLDPPTEAAALPEGKPEP